MHFHLSITKRLRLYTEGVHCTKCTDIHAQQQLQSIIFPLFPDLARSRHLTRSPRGATMTQLLTLWWWSMREAWRWAQPLLCTPSMTVRSRTARGAGSSLLLMHRRRLASRDTRLQVQRNSGKPYRNSYFIVRCGALPKTTD